MINLLKNLSIGKKIVGLSVILLSLMLAAAIYSFVQTIRVHKASIDITATLVPISQLLSAIEGHALEQALMLERNLRHSGAGVVDTEASRGEIARFRELSDNVDAKMKLCDKMLKSGFTNAALKEDAIDLGRLEPELEVLTREHARFHEAAMALVDAVAKKADPARVRYLEDLASLQEDRLDESLDRIAGRVDAAAERQTKRMQTDENRAYMVSTENLALAVLAFFTGAILSWVITRRMVRPVHRLILGAEQVTMGNLDVTFEMTARDEIGQLTTAFQNMIVELRSKARIKETFGKYMDPRVVERLLSDGQTSLNTAEKRVMTVFFSDLQGFSSISESLTAAGLVNMINSYLTLASGPIVENQGVIDKYIGDAIMAFWGPPFTGANDHATRACLAALAQYDKLAEFQQMLPDILGFRKGVPQVNVRIGLCTGELIIGSIGSSFNKSFTVMGDTVNTASRLESANKQYGTRILIDQRTFDMVKGSMEARAIDHLTVVGKDEALSVYELLGEKGKVEPSRIRLRDTFEAGVNAYRERDWDCADRHFLEALQISANDKPTQLFRDRVQTFRQTPPPASWDGVWRLTEK